MQFISVPADAFSHGQIKSKLWLVNRFNAWFTKHMSDLPYVLSWYGSWVGVGPFMLLSQSRARICEINLYELDAEALKTSTRLLEQWHLEGTVIQTHCGDVNHPPAFKKAHYIFINTSCEHMTGTAWLENIPQEAFVLLQSTNMKHPEHINLCDNLSEFVASVAKFVDILESEQMIVEYPNSSFARFMVFGRRR